jgi:hypothetical protein
MNRVLLPLAILLSMAGLSARAQALHPDTAGPEWADLFGADLSDAVRPGGVWTMKDGILTASEDQVLWTGRVYDNFIVDLEYRNAEATNSGVFVYASHLIDWVPYSVEIQIADDYAEQWANAPDTWQAGAVFGHLAPAKRAVRRPGEWNRMTITCQDEHISVVLNGERVAEMNMSQWTSATANPDGSEIPAWLNVPKATLPTYGHIGLQGKHGDAPIWFRNLRIKELD